MTFLRQNTPDLHVIPRDIYNQNAQIRRVLRGQSATEALLKHLQERGIYHRVLVGSNNRLLAPFIACPGSINHLQTNFDVILVDNTYSINRFDMPLIDVIG